MKRDDYELLNESFDAVNGKRRILTESEDDDEEVFSDGLMKKEEFAQDFYDELMDKLPSFKTIRRYNADIGHGQFDDFCVSMAEEMANIIFYDV